MIHACVNFIITGVLTGCGKQKIGAGVNLGTFYLLGIPTAALLAFVFHFNGTVGFRMLRNAC
jgi:Na+-driven multidrug efflux pump